MTYYVSERGYFQTNPNMEKSIRKMKGKFFNYVMEHESDITRTQEGRCQLLKIEFDSELQCHKYTIRDLVTNKIYTKSAYYLEFVSFGEAYA